MSDDPKDLNDIRQFDGAFEKRIGLNAPLIDAATPPFPEVLAKLSWAF